MQFGYYIYRPSSHIQSPMHAVSVIISIYSEKCDWHHSEEPYHNDRKDEDQVSNAFFLVVVLPILKISYRAVIVIFSLIVFSILVRIQTSYKKMYLVFINQN
jgi:hypothetical protein